MRKVNEIIKDVIKERPCFVLAKGQSLSILEQKIENFKHKDICWVSMNDFEYLERPILSKIGKRFDMISDCATASNVSFYEPNIRIPRFKRYLGRPEKNLLMISQLVVQECFCNFGEEYLYNQHHEGERIVLIDEVFSLPGCDKDVWLPPPNSITLLFAFLIAGGAKDIVVFGLDGCSTREKALESYYDYPHVQEERVQGFGEWRPGSLREDGIDFNNRFPRIFELYKQGFKNPNVRIFNCNDFSFINVIPLLSYAQTIKEFGN